MARAKHHPVMMMGRYAWQCTNCKLTIGAMNGGPELFDHPFMKPCVEMETVVTDICAACERPQSKYLDAYYGRDPAAAELCRDCRWKHFKE